MTSDDVLITGYVLLDYALAFVFNLWWLTGVILSLTYDLITSMFAMLVEVFRGAVKLVEAVVKAHIVIGCFFADITVVFAGIVSELARLLALIIVGMAQFAISIILVFFNALRTLTSIIESAADTNIVLLISDTFWSGVAMVSNIVSYCSLTAYNGVVYLIIFLSGMLYYYTTEAVLLLCNFTIALCKVPYQITCYLFELLWSTICVRYVSSSSTLGTCLLEIVDKIYQMFAWFEIKNHTNEYNIFLTTMFISLVVILIFIGSFVLFALARILRSGMLFVFLRSMCRAVMKAMSAMSTRTVMMDNEENDSDNEEEYIVNNGHNYELTDDEHSTPPPSSSSSSSDNDSDVADDNEHIPTMLRPGLRRDRAAPQVNNPLDVATQNEDARSRNELERMLCVVCQENNKSVLLLPCKHLCLCPGCADELIGYRAGRMGGQSNRCPLCRTRVTSRLDVFT